MKVAGRGEGAARRWRRIAFAALVTIIVLVLDQVTKTLAVDHLASGPVHVIGPISLVLAYNSGVAFSLGTGAGAPIAIVAFTIVLVLLWFARDMASYPTALAVGAILGGTFGNLSDRIFRGRGGSVVDFIYTRYWPTFNVADAAVVCGCLGLAVIFWHRGRPDQAHREGDTS